MEILVTSSIIPYLNIMYPHVGPLTMPLSQAPQDLNPALVKPDAPAESLFKCTAVDTSEGATMSPLHEMNRLFLWVKSSATYRLIA